LTLPFEAVLPGPAVSKSLMLAPALQPAGKLTTDAVVRGFLPDASVQGDARRCLPHIWSALAVLRQVLGYGVGRFAQRSGAGQAKLSESGAEIREARADLIALRAARDPAVVEVGLLPDGRCAKLVPHAYVAQFLLRLRQVDPGLRPADARARAEALVAYRLLERGALREVQRDGSVLLAVGDADRWDVSTEELLRELLSVEVRGDNVAAKQLVDKASAPVPVTWRDGVLARSAGLRLPRAFVVVAPRLKPLRDGNGAIIDATIVDSLSLLETALADADKLELP
jgi:hypothetical protein